MARAPLNGTKTHPLKKPSLDALRSIALGPIRRQDVNPGVADRLERENLVECVLMSSPYNNTREQRRYLRITEAGRAILAAMAP